MKIITLLKISSFCLFLLVGVGCVSAAPPYISPTSNYINLVWDEVNTANVTGYNVYEWPPGATNWQFYASTVIPVQTIVLPSTVLNGTAFVVTATNSNSGQESNGSNQWTNSPPPAPTTLQP